MHKRTRTQGPLYGTEVTLTRQSREQRPRTISNPYATIGRPSSRDSSNLFLLAEQYGSRGHFKRCTHAHGRQRVLTKEFSASLIYTIIVFIQDNDFLRLII